MAGVGAVLKRKIATLDGWLPIKLSQSPGCGCDRYARKLDRLGPDQCREHIDEILDVLQRRAKEHGFPFLRIAAKAMVLSAIREAESS